MFLYARRWTRLAALAVVVLTAGRVSAAVNFQLAGGSGFVGAQYVGTGAAALVNNGGTPGFSDIGTAWNRATNNGGGGITTSIQATVDSQGNALANGPTLTVTARQTFSNDTDGILLLNFWHLSHTSDAPPMNTFTLTGVPNGYYDLYLYGVNGAFSDDTPNTRGTTYTIGADSLGVNGGSNNAFQLGVNYVVFAGLHVTDGTITGTYIANALGNHPSNVEGQLNALQLLSVPEPASLAFAAAAIGVAAVVRRSRRGRA